MVQEEVMRTGMNLPSKEPNGSTSIAKDDPELTVLPCCITFAWPAVSEVALDISRVEAFLWTISKS